MICIIMATMLEAKPFVIGLSLEKSNKGPFNEFKRDNILLVISGVGKTCAATTAAYCCQKYRPSSILNLGAAGATDLSHSLGEIYHIDKVMECDRPIFQTGAPYTHTPHILQGFTTAKLATQDRAIIHAHERREISLHAGLVDMEGAPIVQACGIFRRKCVLFKFVSDTPEHTNIDDFVKNIRRFRGPFYEFCEGSVIPHCKGLL